MEVEYWNGKEWETSDIKTDSLNIKFQDGKQVFIQEVKDARKVSIIGANKEDQDDHFF